MDTETIFEQIQEDAFNNFEEKCNGCPHLLYTKDPFMTGDSPAEYTCEVSQDSECRQVLEFIAEIKNNY